MTGVGIVASTYVPELAHGVAQSAQSTGQFAVAFGLLDSASLARFHYTITFGRGYHHGGSAVQGHDSADD